MPVFRDENEKTLIICFNLKVNVNPILSINSLTKYVTIQGLKNLRITPSYFNQHLTKGYLKRNFYLYLDKHPKNNSYEKVFLSIRYHVHHLRQFCTEK